MSCKSCKGKKKTYRCWFCDEADLPAQNVPHPAGWPMVSETLAEHPSNRKAAMEAAQKAGIPTYFDRLGRPTFRDRSHRSKYLRYQGYHDKSGGYGDYTGPSRESELQAEYREKLPGFYEG